MSVISLASVLFALELIGVVAAAASGALSAIKRGMDIFGVLVMASITALGGGFVRDIVVDRFPIALGKPACFFTVVIGVVLAVLLMRATPRAILLFKIFDAIGLAIFSILGAQVGLHYNFNFLSVILLGLLTGIGGGMLRDMLANEVPLVLRQEIYALAGIIGITLLWLLIRFTALSPSIALPLSSVISTCHV